MLTNNLEIYFLKYWKEINIKEEIAFLLNVFQNLFCVLVL